MVIYLIYGEIRNVLVVFSLSHIQQLPKSPQTVHLAGFVG